MIELLLSLFFTAVFLGICAMLAIGLAYITWDILIGIARLVGTMIRPFIRSGK